MNPYLQWIVLPAAAVLAIVGYIALWLWINYRPRPAPRHVEAEHAGADYDWADELDRIKTGEFPALMSHDEYVAAGYVEPPIDGEIVDTVDPLTDPLLDWEDPAIFAQLKAVTPIDLDWEPAWASSFTQYLRVLEPVYALPAGDRDFTGSFQVVPA